jgi:hypothetical protein
MADTYTDLLTPSVYGPAVRCGLRDKSLREKQVNLQDGLKFLQEMERELSNKTVWLDAMTAAGIVAWTAVIVTDIIRNTVKVAPKGGQKIIMDLLDKAHKQAGKHKFDGARYAEEIKRIQQAKDALKQVLPPGAKDLADLFADMAADSLGMAGFTEDATDVKKTHEQSIRTARANVRRMAATLRKIEARIADDARTDEGSASQPQVRQSTPPVPVVPSRLH